MTTWLNVLKGHLVKARVLDCESRSIGVVSRALIILNYKLCSTKLVAIPVVNIVSHG